MKVKNSSDLMLWTYYMIDWKNVVQILSDQKCNQCGEPMKKGEQAVDQKGNRFDCYVCHNDRRVIWLKSK